jgi:uncharacterized protein (DUF2267 family)
MERLSRCTTVCIRDGFWDTWKSADEKFTRSYDRELDRCMKAYGQKLSATYKKKQFSKSVQKEFIAFHTISLMKRLLVKGMVIEYLPHVIDVCEGG